MVTNNRIIKSIYGFNIKGINYYFDTILDFLYSSDYREFKYSVDKSLCVKKIEYYTFFNKKYKNPYKDFDNFKNKFYSLYREREKLLKHIFNKFDKGFGLKEKIFANIMNPNNFKNDEKEYLKNKISYIENFIRNNKWGQFNIIKTNINNFKDKDPIKIYKDNFNNNNI